MGGKLDGRVAVITGGAGGIGQTTAQTLARHGADIAVADIGSLEETKNIVEAEGRRFLGALCDISDEAQVNDLAVQVEQTLGPVDIIVNNAAFAQIVGIEDTSLELWNKTFAVNVTGYFLTIKAFLGQLKRSSAGRIISMSSSAYWTGTGNFTAYTTGKGAVNALTHSLATDLGKYNITVNAVAPSLTRSLSTLRECSEDVFATIAMKRNLKREQTSEDSANVIAFLASDDASFITGQVISVDGGLARH